MTPVILPQINAEDADQPSDLRHLRSSAAKLEHIEREIFEAAQVHRRLCAPRLVRHGAFDVASEIFAVRHLPGDFFSVEETRDGLLLALGDIAGKGLAAGMWVPHLVGSLRTHTAANTDPESIVAGINRDVVRLAQVEPLSTMFVALPDLSVEVVEQRYRALSPLGQGERPEEATVGFAWDAFTADLVVDADGLVSSYPGVASRIPEAAPASP